MTKRNGRKPAPAWLRQQAQQQRVARENKLARQTERQVREGEAKEFLTKLITQTVEQQQRLTRLAPAFADRCWRVHELYGQLRTEWERAEAAEARVKELESQLNGQKKTERKGAVKSGVA